MAKITYTLSTKINKDNGKSEILLRFQNGRGINRRAHSRIWILPKFMNAAKGEIEISQRKLTNDVKDIYVAKGQLEKLINHIIVKAQNTDAEATKNDWLQNVIDQFMFPEDYAAREEKTKASFFETYERFLEIKKFSLVRERHYQVLLRTLHRWELYRKQDIDIDTLSADDLTSYKSFLREEHTFFKTDKNGRRKPLAKYSYLYELVAECRYPSERGDNYINSLLKMFRAFYIWCNDQEITKNDPFRKFTVGTQVYGTPIYINMEERDQIAYADMGANKHLETQRDIFIFQCFIGCRVSDLYSMTKDNVITDKRGTYIEYVPNKTKDENPNVVKVYLTEEAIELLKKYEECHPEKLFPFISQQKYNDAIKDVFRKAGIDRMVTVRNSVTGKNEQRCIADVASSHLARRTFVGNLYKQVKDPSLVGKLSGHKEGSKAFSRYRDIDDDMVREMTELLGGKKNTFTLQQKRELILRNPINTQDALKKQNEILSLLSSGELTLEEYNQIQAEG